MDDAARRYALKLDREEVELLFRLLGHHVLGAQLDRVHTRLADWLDVDWLDPHSPYPTLPTINNSNYPGRAMVALPDFQS